MQPEISPPTAVDAPAAPCAHRGPDDSRVEMTQLIMPNDANQWGTVFGGRVMEWVDIAGGIAAMRHCRRPVVLARMEEMDFHRPIHVGHVARLTARVTWVGRTSLEVQVGVEGEDPLNGVREATSRAILTYVTFSTDGPREPLPPLALETDQDRQLFAEGEARSQRRRARRQQAAES